MYRSIIAASDATGVQEYDQGAESARRNIDIGNGVCRALVIQWLQAKKAGTDYWTAKGSRKEPLMAADKTLVSSIRLQAEYDALIAFRFAPDAATVTVLGASRLTYRDADVKANIEAGFSIDSQALIIATQVLSAKSRYFILSLRGADGGHSIGIFRPYATIGKSSDAYVFDPNFGEFKTTGVDKLRALLKGIQTGGYKVMEPEMRLNTSYILWSYTE